jgi:hypothetical protein
MAREDRVAVSSPVLVRNNFPVNERFPERDETLEEIKALKGEDRDNFINWAAERELDVSDLFTDKQIEKATATEDEAEAEEAPAKSKK